jgi:hypothetical protein
MNTNIWEIITAIFSAADPISGWIGVWIFLRLSFGCYEFI